MTRKFCINCAYFYRSHSELGVDYIEGDWYGFSSNCHLNMWKIGYEIAPNENILEDAYNLTHTAPGRIPKSTEDLKNQFSKNVFDDVFCLTRVPMSDRKWHDLAKYKCRHYFAEKSRGAMSHEKCREEQLEIETSRRFWIPIAISTSASLLAVCISLFSLGVAQ